MGQDHAFGLVQQCLVVAAQIALPPLLAALTVGVLVSIFQATTQIQEQSMVFVPKVAILMIVLMTCGGWMLVRAVEFARAALLTLPTVAR